MQTIIASFILFLAAVATLLQIVYAWGPVTHQTFGCELMGGQQKCFSQGYATNSFILGTSSPDAFKDVSMKLHSFDFAVYQYLYALKLQEQKQQKQQQQQQAAGVGRRNVISKQQHRRPSAADSQFDPVEFSLGYGCHLAQDAVGHYSPSGYLNPAEDHPLELAVDAFQYHSFDDISSNTSSSNGFQLQLLDADAVEFVSQATYFFQSATGLLGPQGSFQGYNTTVLQQSVTKFQAMLGLEMIAITMSGSGYEEEMAEDDYCGPTTTVQDALAHFQLASEWSLDASNYFLSLVTSASSSSQQLPYLDNIGTMVTNYVAELYKAHNNTIC